MPFSSPRNCIFKRNVVVIKDYLWYKLKVFHPSFLRTLWKLFFQRLAEIYTWLEFEKRKKIKCELRFFIFQQNLSRKNWNFWTNIFSVGIIGYQNIFLKFLNTYKVFYCLSNENKGTWNRLVELIYEKWCMWYFAEPTLSEVMSAAKYYSSWNFQ